LDVESVTRAGGHVSRQGPDFHQLQEDVEKHERNSIFAERTLSGKPKPKKRLERDCQYSGNPASAMQYTQHGDELRDGNLVEVTTVSSLASPHAEGVVVKEPMTKIRRISSDDRLGTLPSRDPSLHDLDSYTSGILSIPTFSKSPSSREPHWNPFVHPEVTSLHLIPAEPENDEDNAALRLDSESGFRNKIQAFSIPSRGLLDNDFSLPSPSDDPFLPFSPDEPEDGGSNA
jgi:hypothetical protein